MLNGTNTVSVTTSCSILSCGNDNRPKPIRLAGTCTRYSKNAIPQLAKMATSKGLCPRVRRWPYHANVMKTFEAVSSTTVVRIGFMGIGNVGLVQRSRFEKLELIATSPFNRVARKGADCSGAWLKLAIR